MTAQDTKTNNVYIHIKSGKSYKVTDKTYIKSGDNWVEGVIYSPMFDNGHSKTYVRTAEDFNEKFLEATDIKVAAVNTTGTYTRSRS